MAETAATRGAGHEFEGVLGLLAGWAMAYGRGRRARLVADLAGVGPGDRVVDVGCGPGRFLREAAERGAQATGVEPSAQMRRMAMRRLPDRLRPAIRVVDGVAERLPLPDASATVAWAVASVHHWTDRAAGLAELHRVLEPGGRLLLAESLIRRAGFIRRHGLTWEQAEELAGLARSAGFTTVRTSRHQIGRSQAVVVTAERPAAG